MPFKETCNFKNTAHTVNTVSYKILQVIMFGPVTAPLYTETSAKCIVKLQINRCCFLLHAVFCLYLFLSILENNILEVSMNISIIIYIDICIFYTNFV